MKSPSPLLLCSSCLLLVASAAHAQILVNDTWLDGDRTDPASPGYSEYGVDADADGNLESAWYWGGAGSLTPVGPGGPLRGNLTAGGTSSASWTTYFTPEATPVTLGGAGNRLTITWVFSLANVNAQNTSQNFRLALVDTPGANRLAADGNPPDSTFTGYGMFMNMGGTLGRSTPFSLMERSLLTTGNLLSSSANWASLGDDGNTNDPGYANGIQYTFVLSATRTASGGLELNATMSGGTLGGDGTLEVSFTDATPNTFTFDTFAIRPSGATTTAELFDTTLFRVELSQVPEPAAGTLLGLGLLSLFTAYRRARR
jgi:hypothetical protein